jgi:hypothetical protein
VDWTNTDRKFFICIYKGEGLSLQLCRVCLFLYT